MKDNDKSFYTAGAVAMLGFFAVMGFMNWNASQTEIAMAKLNCPAVERSQ